MADGATFVFWKQVWEIKFTHKIVGLAGLRSPSSQTKQHATEWTGRYKPLSGKKKKGNKYTYHFTHHAQNYTNSHQYFNSKERMGHKKKKKSHIGSKKQNKKNQIKVKIYQIKLN